MKKYSHKEVLLTLMREIILNHSSYDLHSIDTIFLSKKEMVINTIIKLISDKTIQVSDNKRKQLTSQQAFREYAISIIHNNFKEIRNALSDADIKKLRIRRTDPIIRLYSEMKQELLNKNKFDEAASLESKIEQLVTEKMGVI